MNWPMDEDIVKPGEEAEGEDDPTLIVGDVLESLGRLSDKSFDAVITSPPYNLRTGSGGFWTNEDHNGSWKASQLRDGYDQHSDDMPYEAYVAWQREVLTELMRVTDDCGVIFYNHKWRVQGGLLQDRSEIVAGFPVRQVIIWERTGGFNFNDQYFVPTYEVIYMIAKPGFKLIPKANGLGDVWRVGYDRDGNKHPAPMPLGIAKRLIGSISGKRILDPFMGSGTTGVAAQMYGREFTGIDLSPEYVDMARNRINQVRSAPALFDIGSPQ